MAFKEYENPEELVRVQELSTRILGELDRVCRKLGINYAVYGGTAIGAVRHRGFIPWDDDVDVCLERSEYERFLREAPSELGDEFEIVNSRTRDDFPCTYSYLTLKNTVMIPEFYRACTYEKPISIDVFPLDAASDDPCEYKRQARKTWIWGRLMFLRATPAPYLPFDGAKKAVVLAACGLAHGALKLFGAKAPWIQGKWEAAARACEGRQTSWIADFSDRSPLDWAVTREELQDTIDVPFENITVKLPSAYDAILTRGYGEYMKLPPVEKRKNHYPYRLDFGPY